MSDLHRVERDGVIGWLHLPSGNPGGAIGLTHGAGSGCSTPLLEQLAEEFVAHGFAVLRYELPFRQTSKPPVGAQQGRDRAGIAQAATVLAQAAPNVPLYLGGHSYGGRQTSMLAAEQPNLAKALLLLGYPLHPPKQPEKLRTEHFPALRTPCLFIHGSKDEFATDAELDAARRTIPARTAAEHFAGKGHSLAPTLARQIVERFVTFTKE
jgi:predicted alpha/beta-hydrolase family hydrolase